MKCIGILESTTSFPIFMILSYDRVRRVVVALLIIAGVGLGDAAAQNTTTEQAAPDEPRKLALIVAIGKYPAPNIYGYDSINSANDVPLVKEVLIHHGFDDDDILVVDDYDATRDSILQAFKIHLIDQANPGDIIVFHYSGHGHRITDDNADEIDGYDEVLVPFGATAYFDGSYDGSGHIRDDTLNVLLTQLRQAVWRENDPGSVVVFLDACFSGSATRAPYELPVRGILRPMGGAAADRGTNSDFFESLSNPSSNAAGLAPFVVISATRHDELDHEVYNTDGQPVGSLSLALNRTLMNVPEEITYLALFRKIRLEMASLTRLQTPQIEGDVEAELFSGHVRPYKPFITVNALRGDSIAVIDAGTLLGVMPQSRVAFYALDDTEQIEPLTIGVVSAANEVAAAVLVTPADRGENLLESQALVTEYSYEGLDVRVHLGAFAQPERRTAIEEVLDMIPNVKPGFLDSTDLVVVDSTIGVFLKAATEDVTIGGPYSIADDSLEEKITERIRAYARNRFLRNVKMTDPRIDIRLELIPATHSYEEDPVTGEVECIGTDTTKTGARETTSGWAFRPDDDYLLRIRNLGQDSAYVAILSLTPDGGINQLFPDPYLGESDIELDPGASYLIDICFWATEPLGDEVLKLFATRRNSIDFRPIITRGGQRRAGEPLSYFQQVLADAYKGLRTNGAGKAQGAGTTHAIVIKVVAEHQE